MKLNNQNFLEFECSKPDEIILSISQEYITGTLDDTDLVIGTAEELMFKLRKAFHEKLHKKTLFWNLFRVKIYQITLREVLLIESIYLTKT